MIYSSYLTDNQYALSAMLAAPGAKAHVFERSMSRSFIKITYRIETAGDVAALAAKIASDQSTGTFVAVPGETPELKARVAARVVDLRMLEPVATPSFPETASGDARYSRGEADIEFP